MVFILNLVHILGSFGFWPSLFAWMMWRLAERDMGLHLFGSYDEPLFSGSCFKSSSFFSSGTTGEIVMLFYFAFYSFISVSHCVCYFYFLQSDR